MQHEACKETSDEGQPRQEALSTTWEEEDSSDTTSLEACYKLKVMEDLDALLANLQTTTASISSYQKNHHHKQSDQHHHNLEQQLSDLSQISQSDVSFHHFSKSSSYNNNNNNECNNLTDHGYNSHHSNINLLADNRDQVPIDGYSFSAGDYTQYGYPAQNKGSYHSSGGNSGSSTPPPLPPPPADLSGFAIDYEQPIYEQQTFQVREATPSSVSDSSDQSQPQSQSGKDRGQRMSALSNNLSELDQLLMDLNSAQFMAEVDRKSTTNLHDGSSLNGSLGRQPPPVAPKPGSKSTQRTSVDNLLDQLEVSGPQGGRHQVDPMYQELSTIASSHVQQQNGIPVYRATSTTSSASSSSTYSQPQTASTATKELDDLMISLSEFTNKGEVPANNHNEPAYAKPVKSHNVSASSPTSPLGPDHNYSHQPGQRQIQQRANDVETMPGDHLEAMLGDLQSDLSRQGVSVKQKGICAACQKPIVGQVIAALGKTWHVEHFVCAHCEEPLGTRNFYERDSLAYCEKDYHQLFAPRCAYCNGPIIDKCITALERMWHPEHFFCAQCGRPFGEDDFHEKNGKAYCRDDYFQMFAPKCGGCAQPIMENYISALNRQWHPTCFVCWDCRSPFGAGSFFDFEGLPYCETHYHAKKGSLCASCERPITGRCITAMFRKFHPEHFVCAFCLKQLNKGTFKEQNDKPYCHPCFVKLFG